MHTPVIPMQDCAPQDPETSAWLFPLTEMHPGESQGMSLKVRIGVPHLWRPALAFS